MFYLFGGCWQTGQKHQKWRLRRCKPARQTTESIQIYQNIPGSRLPRFSCQIIHVGAKYIHIYMYIYIRSDKSRHQHHESYTKLFSEFLKLEKESRSERHQQNMTIHYPNISVKQVKQCQDNKT